MQDLTQRETFDKLYSTFKTKEKDRIKKLTDRDIKFAHAYLTHEENASKAARSINISERIGKELKNKPAIKDYIDYLKEQRRVQLESSLSLTWDYKAQWLKNIIEFYIDRPQAQLKAIEELNKMQGHYAPVKTQNYHELSNDVESASAIAKNKPEIKSF